MARFVFDAKKRTVDWNFLEDVFLNAGKDLSTNDDGEGIHPRSVLTELLGMFGEQLVVESSGPTDVRVFVASDPGLLFCATGKSQREAILKACLNALAPESPLFKHLEMHPKFSLEETKIRALKLLSNFHHSSKDIQRWFVKRKMLAKDFEVRSPDPFFCSRLSF